LPLPDAPRRSKEVVLTSIIDVKVPDIGDFKDVPIIEISVKPGDIVKLDDPLITSPSRASSRSSRGSSTGLTRRLPPNEHNEIQGSRNAAGKEVPAGTVAMVRSSDT
jgi:pyruvate dehydrogenase E2 component (dihydrolipoamide acetyltransferase)